MSPISLGIAARALLAQQQAIEVISHNIANVNTPGYTRQEAVLETTEDYGVRVRTVRRYVDNFIIGQLRRNATLMNEWQVRHNTLQHIQVLIQEPSDQGLNATLSQFWNAWQDLAAAPESAPVRTNLREVSRRLTNLLNVQSRQLTALQQDLDYRVTTQVQEVNLIASQVAELNKSISEAGIYSSQTNDLRDQRDQLLDRLSQLVNVNYVEDAYGPGMVSVNIGNQSLVVGTTARSLTTVPNGANHHDVVWADGGTFELNGGELYGTLQARDQLIPQEISQLDQLASALITQVNTQHRAGYGLNNSTNIDFFSGASAADISISASINADVNNIATANGPDSPGDGGNALAINDLQGALVMNGGTATIGAFYGEFIAQLGLDAKEAEASFNERDLLNQHLAQQRSSVSGVSLDEESVRLMEHQRAYQAAARMVTVIDEIMSDIILGMGR